MVSRIILSAVLLCMPLAARADEPEPLAKAIQDNSFLVEEAYNQEDGVVQHIFNAQFELDRRAGADSRDWLLTFTQEWPVFSQRHQFSYTLPYGILDHAGVRAHGVGDVLLNYRLQALFESETLPAFAPRFSLVLPTGNEKRGLGDNTLGYQFNLPVSKIVSERWTLHANAGLTFLPDLRGRDAISYRLAGSGIFAVSRNFNLMLELVGDWVETVDDYRHTDRQLESVISPGFRYAFNWPKSQLVLGLAAPIGLNKNTPEIGAFLYASFEHVLWKSKEQTRSL